MKSKFTIKSYLVLILSLSFLCILCIVVPTFFNDTYYEDKLFPKIFVPGITIFAFIYLVFGELRTKCIIIELNKNEIIVKRFFGLITERYNGSEIEGWKYSLLSSQGGTYEYIYLYKSMKKRIKISEFYHSNYNEIKSEIQAQYKPLGYENFSYLDEFKEIFT